MAKELTYTINIIKDGKAVPMEQLTPEEIELWRARMADRLSRTMSEYYTQHPEEYKYV